MRAVLSVLAGLLAIVAAGAALADPPSSTLSHVKERGKLLCGVNGELPGFSFVDERKEAIGFEAEFCKAVAAATLGDARKVQYVPLSIGRRFDALRAGTVDVLLRNSTITLERTVKTGVVDAATIYLDAQAFAVPKALGIASLEQLAGRPICVLKGTPHARNIRNWFRSRDPGFTPVFFETQREMYAAFYAGKCDAVTQDISALSATLIESGTADRYAIIRELVGLAPLGAFVRTGDDQWFNIVRWTFNALLEAESAGISSETAELMRRAGRPNDRRLLGIPDDDGALLGLSGDWAYNVIKQVGNYGEIYERSLGSGSKWKFPRGVNALWDHGGVLYALPLR